jgi:hypothetical protein
MTTMQIVGLAVAAGAAAFFYLPSWPKKPSSLRQIEAVLEIRDNNPSPEVRKACSALLQALLQ